MMDIDFSEYEGQLVELYTVYRDGTVEEEIFSLGYIIKEFDEYFVFQSMGEYGNIDSYQLRKKEHIGQVKVNTEYGRMLAFYIAHNQKNDVFDLYQLKELYAQFEDKTQDEMLNICLQNKKMITVITEVDEDPLFGRIALLDKNIIVLSAIDYEDMNIVVKKSILKEDIISLDLLSVENVLYTKYLNSLLNKANESHLI